MKYTVMDKRQGSCMNEVIIPELEDYEEMSLQDFEQTLEQSEFYSTFHGPLLIGMLDSGLENPTLESIIELEEGETIDVLTSDSDYTAYNGDAFYLLIKSKNGDIVGRYEMREEPYQVENNDIEEWFCSEHNCDKDKFYEVLQKQTNIDFKGNILFTHN